MRLKSLWLLLMTIVAACDGPIDKHKLVDGEQGLREPAKSFCDVMRFESTGARREQCEDVYVRGQMGLQFGFRLVDQYKGYGSSYGAEIMRRSALLCADDKIFADSPEWPNCGRIKYDLLMAASRSHTQANITPVFIPTPTPAPQPPAFQPSPPIYSPPIICQNFGGIIRCR